MKFLISTWTGLEQLNACLYSLNKVEVVNGLVYGFSIW